MVSGNIIITGACGGIGHEVAKTLLDSGISIWAVDFMEDRLNDMYGAINNCHTYVCDLTSVDEANQMIKTIVNTSGKIGGLVHCAGFDKLMPLYLNKENEIQRLFDIHVFSAMRLCKLISKKGNAAEGCSVVLISSLSAHEGATGHTAYAAAKGAIEGFLAPAASEMLERGIRLNEVVLGIIQTQMSAGYLSKMDDKQKESMDVSYPLGLGTPPDVAPMICFLLSDKAKWMTGQKYVLDGGHMVRKSSD